MNLPSNRARLLLGAFLVCAGGLLCEERLADPHAPRDHTRTITVAYGILVMALGIVLALGSSDRPQRP